VTGTMSARWLAGWDGKQIAAMEEAADSLDKWVAKSGSKSGKRSGASKRSIDKAMGEARDLIKAKAEAATPAQLVALYCICYEDVYGIEPIEMVGETWKRACFAAARLVKQEFQGCSGEAMEYLRWTWRREKHREQHRSDDARRWRVTWRQQFVSKSLLSDYRTEMARANRAAERSGANKKDKRLYI